MLYDLDDDIQRYVTMRDELQAEIDAAMQQHSQICRVLKALQGDADVPDGWVPIEGAVAIPKAERALKVAPEPGASPSRGRPRQPIKHGTPGGAAIHRRRDETPCIECKAAEAAYAREKKARRSQETAEAVALGAAPFDPDKAREAAAVTAAPDGHYSTTTTGYEPHRPTPTASVPAKPAFTTDDALAVLGGS